MTEHYDHDQAAAILRPVAQHLATHRPAPSFAEQLTADDYAQADARAATAEQDRDDALDELRHTKADRDRLNGLQREAEADITRLKTHLNSEQARLRGHIERIRGERDQAIASRRQLLDDMDTLTRTIGRQTNENDNLRQQLDATNTERARLASENAGLHAQLAVADADANEFGIDLTAIRTELAYQRQQTARLAYTLRCALNAHLCDDCKINIGATITPDIQEIIDSSGAAPGLGSSRRAQGRCICPVLPGGPLLQAERDPDCSVHGQDARPAQDAWVLDLVRGLVRFEAEHPKLFAQYAGSPDYQEAACPANLLELVPAAVMQAVGAQDSRSADSPVNTEETTDAAVRRLAGELERLRLGMSDRNLRPDPWSPLPTATVDTALTALDRLIALLAVAVAWRGRYVEAGSQDWPLHGPVARAVDELLATWPGLDLSVPAVSIAEAAAKSTVPTAAGAYHWGRAWAPSDIEAKCPCPKAPCGYVIRDQESPDCDQHNGNRTMRGGHSAERCAEDRP